MASCTEVYQINVTEDPWQVPAQLCLLVQTAYFCQATVGQFIFLRNRSRSREKFRSRSSNWEVWFNLVGSLRMICKQLEFCSEFRCYCFKLQVHNFPPAANILPSCPQSTWFTLPSCAEPKQGFQASDYYNFKIPKKYNLWHVVLLWREQWESDDQVGRQPCCNVCCRAGALVAWLVCNMNEN